MLPTLRRSTRTRRSPNRYGEWEYQFCENDLNYIIKAIEILENVAIKMEDPIDKHIDHYNKIGVSVEKSGANSLRFTYEDECPEYYLDDYDFKIALLEAGDDHEKWIQIVEKGIKQWKSNIIDLTN